MNVDTGRPYIPSPPYRRFTHEQWTDLLNAEVAIVVIEALEQVALQIEDEQALYQEEDFLENCTSEWCLGFLLALSFAAKIVRAAKEEFEEGE